MSATNALRRRNLCLLWFFVCLVSSPSGAVTSDEKQLLLKVKAALQNSNTDVFDSWESNNSECNFRGITCNHDGRVTEIELSNQRLQGVVPLESICELESLEKLSLGGNFLLGTISGDLNKCVGLQYLDLGNNFFAGPFPAFSSLTGLKHLYLNNSGFSGHFPWKSLQNISGLITLSIGDNQFEQSPIGEEVFKLYDLNWLYLSNCSINGTIPPEIGNLNKLENLELSENNLSGEIPAEIGKLSNLWQLELYGNELRGIIPVGFRNLSNLEKFDASMNSLEGDLSELKFLKRLVSLQLFDNSFSGNIPEEFGEFKGLVNLSLYSNKLTGPIPPKLGSWANFDFIDVSENFLTGPIPPDMCKNGKMKELLMLQNNFTGEIPVTYANCSTLKRFRVSNNSLSGTVPAGIWGLPNVNIIDIAMNAFEGSITANIANAKALGQLFVANNRLSGELPEEISEASSLVSIDLSYNQISGKIPATIGELKNLDSLYLQNNMLSGKIPKALGSCDSLSDLNIAQNSLSDKIPASLGSLRTLNALNLSRNRLSGEIPASLSSLRLSLLDLSYNRLTGRIPQSLSVEAYNGSFAGNAGLCSGDVTSFRRCPPDSGISSELRTLIVCFVVGSMVLLASLAGFFSLRSKEKEERSLKDDSWDVKSFHILSFTEDEILNSIKQDNLIGKGGSGNVYKVSLSNGNELAVKHIWNSDSDGKRRTRSSTPMLAKRGGKSSEFDAEVQTLSSIRHVNVVKLYCSITSEDSSLLVYEYLPNGSLWDRLHTSRKMELDWEVRYEIALGAAKGLAYLHHSCERPVIHRDVKSSNILLDEFLKPRIADFGLAKIVQANGGGKDSTHVIAGTHGYIAPEYGYTYKVTEKSDVYSFGVVLMELVTGKRPIEPEYGENRDIVSWVYSKIKTRETVLSVVDSRIPESLKEDAVKVLRIAILCTATLPALRPTMRSVVQMIEEAEPCKLVSIIVNKEGDTKKIEGRTEKFNPIP